MDAETIKPPLCDCSYQCRTETGTSIHNKPINERFRSLIHLHCLDGEKVSAQLTTDYEPLTDDFINFPVITMADGLNQVRAIRVNEIINDFSTIQARLAAIRVNPSPEEYNEEGFVVLRTCVREAQALLAQPFQQQGPLRGDEEQNKAQLRRIIADAAIRRFQAQKLLSRALAVLRWVGNRNLLLRGSPPHAGHAPALQQLREALRAELASITDARVELSLRQPDMAAGKWLAEDPPLAVIQRVTGGR